MQLGFSPWYWLNENLNLTKQKETFFCNLKVQNYLLKEHFHESN